MSINQKSGHGTLLAVELDPVGAPGVFTDIAEMGDITLPQLTRNEFDGTTQNENIDSYVTGVLRRGPFSVALNWIPDDPTHDHITGVFALMIANQMTGWRVTLPMVSPAIVWVMSGQITSLSPVAPVDGKLTSDMIVRFSGVFTMGGTVIGT